MTTPQKNLRYALERLRKLCEYESQRKLYYQEQRWSDVRRLNHKIRRLRRIIKRVPGASQVGPTMAQ